jgi:hypothetical protein
MINPKGMGKEKAWFEQSLSAVFEFGIAGENIKLSGFLMRLFLVFRGNHFPRKTKKNTRRR